MLKNSTNTFSNNTPFYTGEADDPSIVEELILCLGRELLLQDCYLTHGLYGSIETMDDVAIIRSAFSLLGTTMLGQVGHDLLCMKENVAF